MCDRQKSTTLLNIEMIPKLFQFGKFYHQRSQNYANFIRKSLKMSYSEQIKIQKSNNHNSYKNYLLKLQQIELQNEIYREKIIKLLNSKSQERMIKKQGTFIKTKKLNNHKNTNSDFSPSAEQFSSEEQIQDNPNFHKRHITTGKEHKNRYEKNMQPTEEQLCEILTIIKTKIKKTSIQLAIKIFHQIVCLKDEQQINTFDNSYSETVQNPLQSKFKQRYFRNYNIRFRYYKERVKKNYNSSLKQECISTEIKQEETESQADSATKFSHQRFIEFSTPHDIVEYFKFKNSLPFKKFLDRQPFSERRFLFKEFSQKGHIMPNYSIERKTAKVFCLVGPGVRAARPFLGEDLGSNSHSKTISNIVKNGYRALEQYINDNLHSFLKPIDTQKDPNINMELHFGADNVIYPCYYASRRQLSGIKTPLFNCRNWMTDEELQLFFLFIKKIYYIKYPKEWEQEKISEIFLLFGRVIKKLMQKDILLRNLQVLRGQDLTQLAERKQQHKKISRIQVSKLFKDREDGQNFRKSQDTQKVIKKVIGKSGEYENKYKKYASVFRSEQ